jgi:hypothetical protein
MTFTLTIELGNDAMQTGADIGASLQSVAERLIADDVTFTGGTTQHVNIRDANSNTVGKWEVSK